MKINSLLEFETASSSPLNASPSAPKFGRSDKFLEEEQDETVEECTTSGSIASVASPVGGMQRRGKGDIFAGINTSEKFPNSAAVKEEETDEGMFGFGSASKPAQQRKPLDYSAVRQMSQQSTPQRKVYQHPEEYRKLHGEFDEGYGDDDDYSDFDYRDEIAQLENQIKYTKSEALRHTLYRQLENMKRKYGVEDEEEGYYGDFDDEGNRVDEVRKASASTKAVRTGLSKRPRAELSDKEKATKKAESDRLWDMLQQHIAQAEKEKDVKEARVGNRMSDISVGSPKIVNYKGKAVGEVGIDHEPSPGNGPYYWKHYLTGKYMVGYDTKQEALADLKYLVMQNEGVAEEQVNEKSKSQAQFRTMAAVAHNPKFAKKVGISQKVGKEFHSADKKQDYKDLPAKVEAANPAQQAAIAIAKKKEQNVDEEKQRLDPKCWKGYKKQGTKMKGDTRVNNCVPVSEAEVSEDKLANDLYRDLQIFKKGADKDIGSKAKDKEISSKAKDKDIIAKESFNGEYDDEAGSAESNLLTTARAVKGLLDTIGDRDNLPEWVQEKIAKAEQMLVTSWDYLLSQKEQGMDPQVDEDWQKVNKRDKTDGMSPKAVKAYRRENPGSKLKTAVTKKPSELKAGSKDANRRKSFCARMSGVEGPMKDEKGRPTPKAKALRRWNC